MARTKTPPKPTSRRAAPKPKPSQTKDPVTRYAKDVVAGRIVAGPLVRLACQRHLNDLKSGKQRGLRWDVAAVQHVLGYFRDVLRLNGGEFEGRPFLLQPWQAFIVGSLHGWKQKDGTRRFRSAYIEIGKGNGKSPIAAGLGLYALTADGHPRAEVYAAATKKDQAMILFRDAVAMVKLSPALRTRSVLSGTGAQTWNIAWPKTESFFRPISSDDGQSGPRPHCGLLDELHEHKSPLVVDMMRAGVKGDPQPLIIEITNSGFDRNSVCFQHHEYSDKVVNDVLHDDEWFAYVCGLDPDDDWRDEKVWLKANPNLGISIKKPYLRQQVREAEGMPARQNTVKRLNFCVWTQQAKRWMDLSVWDRGNKPVEETKRHGMDAYLGLDLSATTDLTSLAIVIPVEGGAFEVFMRYWVPEAKLKERSQRADRVPYDLWRDQGLLSVTGGEVVDYDHVQASIQLVAEQFAVKELAFDRWNASALTTRLAAHGITVVDFGQGFASLSPPTKGLMVSCLGGKVHHGGHPILRWNISNLTVAEDPAGNLKPDKARSTEKIDGAVALIMALGRAQLMTEDGGSVYDERGLIDT